MTNNNPFTDFFAQNDFSKMFEGYQSAPFDMKAMLDSQMKNAQALSEAQQITLDNIQEMAQRQSQFLSQMTEENSKMAQQMMTEGTPEAKLAQNAEMMKALYEKSVSNLQNMSEMINKSNKQATGILNKRVSASMTEIKETLEKSQKKAA